MPYWLNCVIASGYRHAAACALPPVLVRRALVPLVIATLGLAASLPARADAQRDPELRAIVSAAISAADCFPDKFESAVWYTLMEPKLHNVVPDPAERMQILKTAFCEAHRPREQRLPPGLIMAVMDVESRFDRWAVSSAGAVGLMQVMPFWPSELGMKRHQLTQIEANMRMGCAILRFYLRMEHNDVRKALARYNGSVGRRKYPDQVVNRWTRTWNGADDLGVDVRASR
jgi:soluble lytic murein transglycosylase-like protein